MQNPNLQSVFNKQRIDKFRLVLTMPEILRSLDDSDFTKSQQELINSNALQFSLFGCNIPSIEIPSKDVPHSGQTMRVTSQSRTPMEPVTCKFSVDNRFRNYWVLWKWLEKINNPRESWMHDGLSKSGTYWNYQTLISLYPLDEYNESMCEFLFYNSFITRLGGFNFDYQLQEEAGCEFTFTYGQMDIKILN